MNRWALQRSNVFAEWHLLAEPPQKRRGLILAACGQSLGDEFTDLLLVDDESVIGNRCAVCQWIVLRW